jgi:hypothetical protein
MVKIWKTEDNLAGIRAVCSFAHTSGLHAACMHRRCSPVPDTISREAGSNLGSDWRPDSGVSAVGLLVYFRTQFDLSPFPRPVP